MSLSLPKILCISFVFCVVTAVASHAQTFTTLVSFNNTDGSNPEAPLMQASDGNFYGTTTYGGAAGLGSVFKITPSGMLTTLYSFCHQQPCLDGVLPYSALVQATDGNFYGTTSGGGLDYGSGGEGTVFKITPSGTLTTLYVFCSLTGCPDGGSPLAGLALGADGNFYGTTSYGGGPNLAGTVFKITPGGTLTTLYSVCAATRGRPVEVPVCGLHQSCGRVLAVRAVS